MKIPNAAEDRPDRRVRVLVGLYPTAGRHRYATEFAALLEDSGVGVRQFTPSVTGLRAAAPAGAVATTLMAVAVTASVGWGLATFADRPGFAALTGYGTVMAVAATSSARGLRAAIARTRGSVDAH